MKVSGQEEVTKVSKEQKNSDKIKMYGEYTEDNFRKAKNYDLKVYGAGKIKDYTVEDNEFLFSVAGQGYQCTQQESDGELRPFAEETEEEFQIKVRIKVCGDKIFRITASQGDKIPEHETVMTEGEFKDFSDFSYNDFQNRIEVKTETSRLLINKEKWCLKMLDEKGKLVFSQEPEDKVLDFAFEGLPFGFAYNPNTEEYIAAETIKMRYRENFFGFGEQFTPVNKKQQEVDVWITDPLSCKSPRTYLSLPFFMSSKGYGLFVNTHYRSKFFMGNRSNSTISFHVYNDLQDYFLINGPSFKEILENYTKITGKSPMLPKWSFGLWMSRCSYSSQKEVENIAEKLREHEIPCDVMNIDTHWFDEPWACDWKFGEENFPNPKAMLNNLKEKGIKISLWQKPYITVESLPDLTEFMLDKGWLPLNEEGELARRNPVLDISNPEAKEWYQKQLKKLFDLGVKVIKTDMGEGVPPEGQYYGYNGYEMRNIYAYLYNQAAFEATKEHTGEGIVWGRSGYAGSQKFPLIWGGDPTCDFEGLRFSLRAGLSLGFSGFTFWSHDIGGFLGRPSVELYIRWTQVSAFTSHCRAHGTTPREPWNFGVKAEDIFKKYINLRYQLIPYIYSTSYLSSKKGLPVLRHLALEYQDDPMVYHIDDQYLFGEDFLVAPILAEDNQRKIYLPKGKWIDYWDHKVYQGNQWIDYEADLETLPLLVKAGSINPFGKKRDYIDKEKEEELTFNIYCREKSSNTFLYYEEEQEYKIRADFNKNIVKLNIPDLAREISIKLLNCKKIKDVIHAGNEIQQYNYQYEDKTLLLEKDNYTGEVKILLK